MKKYLVFNTNIIIAGLCGLGFSILIGKYAQNYINSYNIISGIVTISHFAMYMIINGFLYKLSNSKKYKGKTKQLFEDLLVIYIAQIPTFILYYFIYYFGTNIFLHLGWGVIVASCGAWLIGTLLSRIVHTLILTKTHIFK